MENKITPELIEQAKAAKNAEEILALAKENGVELTNEAAQKYYDQFHQTKRLSDEELSNVSGGGCGEEKGRVGDNDHCAEWLCVVCGTHDIDCPKNHHIIHRKECHKCKFAEQHKGSDYLYCKKKLGK